MLLSTTGTAGAATSVTPPCELPPRPSYSAPDAPPNIRVLSGDQDSHAWAAPACTGWVRSGFRTLVALAASFSFEGSAEDLLARFGAVSSLKGIKYWTAGEHRWRILINESAALDGPRVDRRRADFTPAELKDGQPRYFLQDDSRSTGAVIYRMRVLEAGRERLVVAIENASPIRMFLVTLFHPGDLQSVYFLERRSPGMWGVYSLLRTGRGANALSSGHEQSFASRAVAFYRHLAGIPTDQNPPALLGAN